MENWKTKLNADATEWLLKSNPWTRYNTLIDILGEDKDSEVAVLAKKELLASEQVQGLISDTLNWQPIAPTGNNDSKISYYKLRMIADFGLTIDDESMKIIADKATSHVVDDMFAARGTIPVKMKKGEEYKKPDPYADVWHASPCNSPIITYALKKIGRESTQLDKAIDKLVNNWEESYGWFCHFFFVEGQFKKLQAGCPMAALMALEVFSLVPHLKESPYAKRAFEALKFHYEYGKTLYYFGRSKKFWTLKYPFVWYNALYLAEVLTRFEFTKGEPLVRELIDWIIEAQDEQGRYKSTSIFMPYKSWDFGNKREASPWITFLCYRILKRFYG